MSSDHSERATRVTIVAFAYGAYCSFPRCKNLGSFFDLRWCRLMNEFGWLHSIDRCTCK
jgi:hypothetical protein